MGSRAFISCRFSYWVSTPGSVEAIVSGEVNTADSVTNVISAGFSLFISISS